MPAQTQDGSEAPARVRVDLGERAYDVVVGPALLRVAPALIQEALGRVRSVIVTDKNVAARHLAPLEAALAADGRHAGTVVLPPGEGTKSFRELAPLCERLLELGIERGDAVIALGGGVIGDLAGFAASVLRRGVRYVQIPTTLLAQVDSSVGGKTGINTPQGKNLIGAFHQPSLVLADTDLLGTLPAREMRAGYAEVVKYGLLGDAQFFEWLEQKRASIFAHDAAALVETVRHSVQMKADIVSRDERETGDRALLNLGHTFGHALEAFTGYSERLLHGEAVAIGTCVAFRLSEHLGLCPAGTARRVSAHFEAADLPTRVKSIGQGSLPTASQFLEFMRHDKKVKEGRLTLILVRGIGRAFTTRDVSESEIEAALERELAR
jgi:3-dehydroquinate synthase